MVCASPLPSTRASAPGVPQGPQGCLRGPRRAPRAVPSASPSLAQWSPPGFSPDISPESDTSPSSSSLALSSRAFRTGLPHGPCRTHSHSRDVSRPAQHDAPRRARLLKVQRGPAKGRQQSPAPPSTWEARTPSPRHSLCFQRLNAVSRASALRTRLSRGQTAHRRGTTGDPSRHTAPPPRGGAGRQQRGE